MSYKSSAKTILKVAVLVVISCLYLWILLISFFFSLTVFWIMLGSLAILFTLRQTAVKSIFISLILFFLLTPLNLKQYDQKSIEMQEAILAGKHLPLREKLAIYNLNILLGVGAYPFYPEVAKEVWLMHIPIDGNIRTTRDSFFMKSTVVQKHIKQGKMGRVSWGNGKEYKTYEELRYGTALNPSKLLKTDGGHAIEVEVSYPRKSRTLLKPFGRYLPFYVEEGLMNYLQQQGWLHPYTQIYTM